MIVPGVPVEITAEELLDRIPNIELAHRYVTNFKQVGKRFKSELRFDRNPNSSFIFEDTATRRLKYKDFGDPRLPTQINLIEYVAFKYNITLQEAANKVAADFNITETNSNNFEITYNQQYYRSEGRLNTSSDLIIKIKSRNWTKSDIEYWESYSIPISLLERNNIKSISHLWLYKNGKLKYFSEYSKSHLVFSYDYYVNEGIFRRKIYRPHADMYKWISNTDYTVVQNYPNIPKKGDLLFAQSSYKDCMVMEMMDYWAVASNTENVWLPDEYWIKLKNRWKTIVYFGNNDWDKSNNPGLNYAIRHSENYNIPYIIIPDGETSDISDYVQKYGLDEGKRLVEKLLIDGNIYPNEYSKL